MPITVCRRILTWVQETPLHMFMPSNSHKSIHRTLSLTVCIVAVVHSALAIWSYRKYRISSKFDQINK